MVVLARKDVHVARRRTPEIRLVDPGHLQSTEKDREAFAPLREILDDAGAGIRGSRRR